ncbi:hypothetical protein A3K72_01775 [Candidatus Woesearchaeota archaeon RBG_13_36_6]|nr:MAG: hypothetical protein A3K72_01775 [Candidatus Woesearchaeota archaeon RBG_13_36_6]
MKKSMVLLVILFLISLSSVQAENEVVTAKGYVTINIINQPPRLISLFLAPEVAYEDSVLECNPEIIDEALDKVKVDYKWYRNGALLDTKKQTLSGFEEEDYITCEATPIDAANLKGNTLTKTIQIKKTPLTTKAAMLVMNSLGAKANTAETIALQQQGMTAITGYVVGEMSTSTAMLPIFLFFVILLVLVNINLIMRYLIKRRSYS